jgi:hypothetical protein
VWQLDLSEYETTTSGIWRLAGVCDYSKYEYGWPIAPTCTGADTIASVKTAIAEAEHRDPSSEVSTAHMVECPRCLPAIQGPAAGVAAENGLVIVAVRAGGLCMTVTVGCTLAINTLPQR